MFSLLYKMDSVEKPIIENSNKQLSEKKNQGSLNNIYLVLPTAPTDDLITGGHLITSGRVYIRNTKRNRK